MALGDTFPPMSLPGDPSQAATALAAGPAVQNAIPADSDTTKNVKEKILKRLLEAAKRHKEPVAKMAKQISVFAFNRKIEFKDGLDPAAIPFDARLSKGSQYIDVVGNMLFQRNPDHKAEPQKWATPQAIQRAQLSEDYLNYCSSQDSEEMENKLAVIDGLLCGTGVIRGHWDKDKNLAAGVHVPFMDYFQDPDASSPKEVHWKAVRRRKPKWWLLKEFPDASATILELAPDARKPSELDQKSNDFTTDTICFYEMYFDIGLHNYQEGAALLGGDEDNIGDDSPTKYTFTESGKLLDEATWEVPLFRRQKWPLIELRFKEVPGELWARSPFEAGIPQLEGMNYQYRVWMARLKLSARTLLVRLRAHGLDVGAENMDKIENAATEDSIFDTIEVVINEIPEGGADINKMIQQFHIDAMTKEFIDAIEWNSAEFEKATGLYGVLFQGQTETQMRSAQAVNLTEKTSRSRIDSMSDKVEKWASEVATAKIMIARFLSTPDDITPILGPQAGQAWGTLMVPEADRMQAMIQQGAPPQIAQQLARYQTMDAQNNGQVDYDSWLSEAEYYIVSGTTKRKDTDEELAVYNQAAQQLVPEMISSGNFMLATIAMAIQRRQFEIAGAPQSLLSLIDKAVAIMGTPPPPPPGMPGNPITDRGGPNGSNRPSPKPEPGSPQGAQT